MINDILNIDLNEIYIVSLRALLSLIILFLITKIIGKKQVSELSLFDYVISISIGNFAAEMSMNLDEKFINGVVSVLIFGGVGFLVSFLTLKSITLRRFFMGSPTIIIENGNFIYKNLKRLKLDINDFLEIARLAGYFDVREIKYAIMEANGRVSFLQKEEYMTVNNKNLKVKFEKEGLCANVIIDGNNMKKNLLKVNKDEKWLMKNIKVKGYKLEDILLGTLDINDNLVIYKKKENEDILNVLE